MVEKCLPLVSVVVPMHNEADFIGNDLKSILQNDYPAELIEILVVDGGSTDGSIEIVQKMAKEHTNITLLGGPGVNCPAAMNIGIENSHGEVVCKVDAHGYVDSNFIRLGVKHLRSDKDIKCVGGPIRPIAKSLIEQSNVLARSSVFGVGGGINTAGEEPQFTDTVQCGIYERETLFEVGLFDESLQFGEDEDVNWRLVKAGYKIYCTPEIKFYYYPRKTFKSFYKQYYKYGKVRVKVAKKLAGYLRLKHLMPSVFVVSLLLSGVLSVFYSLFVWLFLIAVISYVGASLVFAGLLSKQKEWWYVFILPISFACLHFGYGFGFLRGVWDFLIRKKN